MNTDTDYMVAVWCTLPVMTEAWFIAPAATACSVRATRFTFAQQSSNRSWTCPTWQTKPTCDTAHCLYLIKVKQWPTAQLTSSAKLLNLSTSLLCSTISTGYQSAAGFNPKQLSSASTLSPYFSGLLHLYSLSHSLHSASDTQLFHVPRMSRRTLGVRFFQYIGSVIRNSLPLSQAFVFILLGLN